MDSTLNPILSPRKVQASKESNQSFEVEFLDTIYNLLKNEGLTGEEDGLEKFEFEAAANKKNGFEKIVGSWRIPKQPQFKAPENPVTGYIMVYTLIYLAFLVVILILNAAVPGGG